MPAARHYCFTSFEDHCPVFTEGGHVRYMIYQRERCPKTFKEHWQGYVELKRPIVVGNLLKKTGLKALLQSELHAEPRRGTRDQARAYCMKEDTRLWGPYEFGSWDLGGQGARSDLKSATDMVKRGASDADIANDHPVTFARMSRGLRDLRCALSSKRRAWKTHVSVYWSVESGTGKSMTAHDELPDAFVMTDEKGWWDGYTGQKDVIIDDFRAKNFSESFMLNLLDRYPMRVPIKGASVEFAAERLIITSNDDPSDWYPSRSAHIMRRIDNCVEFGKKEVPAVEEEIKPVKESTADDLILLLCAEECSAALKKRRDRKQLALSSPSEI